MKVIGIIGSMRGKNSREYEIIKRYLKSEKYKNAAIKILTADSLNINFCQGCCSCFNTGICPLDSKDDMKKVKTDLLEADLIIVSSPVYAHQVSGFMKNLIDRLSYWSHTFHLIGKHVIICTSTASSGSEYVLSYLKKIMSALGCIVIGELNVTNITSVDELNEQFQHIEMALSESLNNFDNINITTFQHVLFKSLRTNLIKVNGYEHNYWMNNHMFNYFTFKDYLMYKLSLQKKQSVDKKFEISL